MGAFPYSQIYSYYAPAGQEVDTAGYIMFIGISVTVATVVGSVFMFTVPAEKPEEDVNESTTSSAEDNPKGTASYIPDGDAKTVTPDTNSVSQGGSGGAGTSGSPSTPELTGMTGKEMLKSMVFWLYAGIWLFQQGLMYFTNTGLVVSAARQSLGAPTNEDDIPAWLANQTAQHTTMFSIAQGIACVAFGAAFDYVGLPKKNVTTSAIASSSSGKKEPWKLPIDNSSLLFLDMAISIIPILIVGFSTTIGSGMLLFCSFLVGIGWGAGFGLFTALTLDFFGQKAFGLALALAQVLPPVGIFAWTQIFAIFYD
ncbi:hypothetical protein HK102_010773, partial [Quaeritorhiza haematococci]